MAGAGTSGEGHTAAYYWSSTSNANNDDNAWNVNFNNGNVNNNNKDNDFHVRVCSFKSEDQTVYLAAFVACHKDGEYWF
jgi:hypothetical protein